MRKNMPVILLCGESGCGKTTIAEKLETFGIKQNRSYTTRPRRYPTEDNHEFVTDDEFDKLTNIVATTNFAGHRYATTIEQVDICDVLVLDVNGIEYFKSHYQGIKKPYVIYIKTSEKERIRRMAARQNLEEAQKRIEHDKIAFKDVEDIADFVLINEKRDDINYILDFCNSIWFYGGGYAKG